MEHIQSINVEKHLAQALESHANRQGDSSINVGFGAVPGASPGADGKKCYDKATTVVQDAPKEQCTLELQRTCKHVTKMVPKLEATEQCVDVPKEVRTRSSNSNSEDAMDEKPITGRGSLHKEASIKDKENGLKRRVTSTVSGDKNKVNDNAGVKLNAPEEQIVKPEVKEKGVPISAHFILMRNNATGTMNK